MPYYLVTGRQCFDDEDTSYVYQVDTVDAAIEQYKKDMWAASATPEEDRALLQERGEGIFINGVFSAETEITEAL